MDAVSSGETPMAFSISIPRQRCRRQSAVCRHTAEAVELELIDAIDLIGVLPIVLDEIDVVRGGEQSSER